MFLDKGRKFGFIQGSIVSTLRLVTNLDLCSKGCFELASLRSMARASEEQREEWEERHLRHCLGTFLPLTIGFYGSGAAVLKGQQYSKRGC